MNTNTLLELMKEDEALLEYTYVGVTTEIFDNEKEIKDKLKAETVGDAFKHLKKEVEEYYGESN